MERPELSCIRCKRRPAELHSVKMFAQARKMSPDDFVWHEDGTLNKSTGAFACDDCYVLMGMPLRSRDDPRGAWKAGDPI
jgi:hypothetical protein